MNVRLGVGLLLSIVVGCSSAGDRPELGQVEGVVTLDGQPLPSCSVHFDPQGARSSSGFTDAQGKYQLRYIRDIRGAALGKHQVRILDTTGQRRVPRAYSRTGLLTATVEPGNNKINFQLKSNPKPAR